MAANHDPTDLRELDENDQCREVYAWAGLALYHAQVVEHGIINVILLARVSEPAFRNLYPTADDFYDAHFRQMLGRLISGLRGSLDTSDIDQLLADARERRNFVVHGFFRERIDLLLTEAGRQLMVNELADAVRAFRDLDARLEELTRTFGAKYGITEATIREELRKFEERARNL